MNTLVEHRNVTIRLKAPIEDFVVCIKCKGARTVTHTSFHYYNPEAYRTGGIVSCWAGGLMWCPVCLGHGYWKPE